MQQSFLFMCAFLFPIGTLDPTDLESKNYVLFLKIRECEHEEVEFYFSAFSRQEYWSGLLFPSPGDLPNPETRSPAL